MAGRVREPDEVTAASPGGMPVAGLPDWQLARRQRIVLAALRALEEQEYDKIQIRDVAQSAEVALGTLYRYFSSKEHLYAAALREWAGFEQTRPARAARLDPEVRVRRRIHSVIKAFQKQPQFFKVFTLLQASADVNARELLAAFEQVAWDSLTAEFQMLPPAEARDAAVMVWSMIDSLVARAVYWGTQMSEVHRVIDRFLDVVFEHARALD